MLLSQLFEDTDTIKATMPSVIHWISDQPNDPIVWVDVAKLDDGWKKDRDLHVGPGGNGGIRGRHARFGEWIREGHPVRMPQCSLIRHDPRGGVAFGNGRHRFSWCRDHGVTALPVTVCEGDRIAFRRQYGMAGRMSTLHAE